VAKVLRISTFSLGSRETSGSSHAPEKESFDAMPHSQPHEWRLPVSLEFEAETIEDAAFENGSLFVEMNEGLSGSREHAGVRFEQKDYFKLVHYPSDLDGV
jgi:hypothetical protein